jgi:hypothetical protein
MCKCKQKKDLQIQNKYFQDEAKFGFILKDKNYLYFLDKIRENNNYIYEKKTEEMGNFGYRYTLALDPQSYIAERYIYNAIMPIKLQDKIRKSYPYE